MVNVIKNYIKTKPRLYDLLNGYRPIDSPTESWLDRLPRQRMTPVTFVQIGASDGLRWDPLRRFIVKGRWAGVLVEPLPPVFEMLKANYAYLKSRKLEFINAAVSFEGEESIDIWSYSPEFLAPLPLEEQLFFLRKSSLNKAHVKAALGAQEHKDENVQKYRVKCLGINDLLAPFGERGLDLLMIDAEGHDDRIIRTIDFTKCQPMTIIFESHNLVGRQAELKKWLEEHSYSLTELGGDSVATYRGKQ